MDRLKKLSKKIFVDTVDSAKTIAILIVVLLILSWVQSTFVAKNRQYNKLVNEAYQEQLMREYSEAIELYKEAIEVKPKNSFAYFELMRIYAFREDYDLADGVIKDAQELIKEEDVVMMYLSLGGEKYQDGEVESALKYYDQALEIDPQSSIGLTGKAAVYIKQGDLNDIDSLLSHVEGDSTLVDTWDTYSRYMNDGNISEEDLLENTESFINQKFPYLAVSLIEKYLENNDSSTDIYNLLGRAYFEYGDYIEAENAFLQADTTSSEVLASIAKVKFEMGEYEDAHTYCINSLNIDNDAAVLLDYAKKLKDIEQYDKALALLDEYSVNSTQTDIQELDTIYMYMNLLTLKGEVQTAIERSETIPALFDKDMTLINRWLNYETYLVESAELYMSTGDYEKAKELLETASLHERFDANTFALLTEVYAELEDVEAATESLRKTREYNIGGDLDDKVEELVEKYAL